MKLLNKLLLAITAVAIITSCSKLEDSITPAPEVGTHNAGNLDPASPNFHLTAAAHPLVFIKQIPIP